MRVESTRGYKLIPGYIGEAGDRINNQGFVPKCRLRRGIFERESGRMVDIASAKHSDIRQRCKERGLMHFNQAWLKYRAMKNSS